MKKLVLTLTLFFTVIAFAQKDELKTLKKIYAKETISEKDLEAYKAASDALQNTAVEEADKVYAKFYKVMYPTVVLASKGEKATLQDKVKLYDPAFVKEYGTTIDETIDFEKKSDKKIYTDELIEEKAQFKKELSTMAMSLNTASKFKEASGVFYTLYTFDPKNEGKSLLNASILAVQAKDYILAEKLYEEYYASNYFANGTVFYATNKATGTEDELNSKEERTKLVSLGAYEKSRDVKVSSTKPEIIRTLAILAFQNGNLEKAKGYYAEARVLLPNDEDLATGEFNIYFNEGYKGLTEEAKLVEQINASTKDKKKYDELMAQRKAMFQKTIPAFEKAFAIKPNDANTKTILKMAYEITGQTEKAKAIN